MGLGAIMSATSLSGFHLLWIALRNGSIVNTLLRGPGGGMSLTREQNPVGFWLTLLLAFVGSLACAGAAYLFFRYPLGAHDQLSFLGKKIRW
jgi:hypothetical protein